MSDPASQSRERREVHYSGHVQGVGFRYTARHIAARHPVTGYVQNLPDGRVLLVVEGLPSEIDRYLAELEAELERYIRGRQLQTSPATGQLTRFEVRH